MIIKMKGANYADTLKKVKEKIDPENLDMKITNIRSTARGNLLLQIGGGVEKAEKLKKEIDEKNEAGMTTELVKSFTSIMIWGIEPNTTEGQIREALESKVGKATEEEIKVASLRTLNGGNMAATISVNRRLAREILKEDRIRIGWTYCRLREKINVVRCFRCLEHGHRTRECNGPDRTNQCLNCGQQNHLARDCKSESYCNTCNIGEYRADQMRCLNFRKMVAMKVNETKRGKRKPTEDRRLESAADCDNRM